MSRASHADLGGAIGHGRVVPEPEGELFHAAWEPRALALTLAMGATGAWNIDMSRSARETLPNYGALGYYAIWIEALQKLIAEKQKKKGKRVIQDDEPDKQPKGSNVVDLMAALKKSIDSGARTPAKKAAAE